MSARGFRMSSMATVKTPLLSKQEAIKFADKWKSFSDEKQHARGFWSEFFRTLCGVDDEEIAGIEYEKKVKSSLSGNQEYIDVYWKNVALIEHKSAGENLDKAELQARGYLKSLPPGYRPRTIIISDFANFRLIDEKLNRSHQFTLAELPNNIHRFESIISGSRPQALEEEINVDQVAAKLMANLYLELESHGFEGHETSIFLIRILFLMFGDDTGMWERNLVKSLILKSKEDGSDIGKTFDTLFKVLNSPENERNKKLEQNLSKFPYVNGGIFSEDISVIDFNKKMRVALINVANYDWASINPAIFGAMFQLVKSKDERRELGEHYTSEENINKIVYPLFLDELQERLSAAWDNKKELKKLRQDLAKINVLDPACGCGNFLVVSYRHLRQLELELIVRLNNLEGKQDTVQLDGIMGLSITLNQFYGIEIEEWPAQVARMALFLTDHQENLKLERITGATPNRFPLVESAKITHANALNIDWSEVAILNENTIILGNPPFVGAKERSSDQSHDHDFVWKEYKGAGALDFVTCWFLIASKWIGSRKCKAAFVSTNSIAQGRQPDILWQGMNKYEVKIDFAYQSFRWENGEAGEAVVTCVIIGFSHKGDLTKPQLWLRGAAINEPIEVSQINPYLVDGPMVTTPSRRIKISSQMSSANYGSIGYDDGSLVLDHDQFLETLKAEPQIEKFLKKFVGGREMLYNEDRYCIWLSEAQPNEIKGSKFLQTRLAEVKAFREASNRAATNNLSKSPGIFGEIRQPSSSYVAVAKVSSEKRKYVPSTIFEKEVIASGSIITICSKRPFFDFAVVCSRAFAIWNEAVSGRMKTDFQVSVEITYNNFPFPEISKILLEEISAAGEKILATRSSFPNSTLADLYDSVSMPPELIVAHDELDSLISKAFGLPAKTNDAKLLSALFTNYEALVSSLTI